MAAALAAHVTLLLVSPRPPRAVPAAPSSGEADTTLDLDPSLEPSTPGVKAEEASPRADEAPIGKAPSSGRPAAAAPGQGAEAPAKGPSAPPSEANAKVADTVKEPSVAPPSAGSPQGVAKVEGPSPPPAEPTLPPGPPAGPSPPPGDEYGGPAAGSDVKTLPPGVGGPSLWSLPGMIPSAAPPKPASTVASGPPPVDPNVAGQVLSGSLNSRDKTLGIGLPAAGAVATTLADAVRSSAPVDARATFEVKLGGGGQVEGVRLVSATAGDAGTWARVVASAKGTLGARALQMNGDGKGATVLVKVESYVQYPAGSKKAVDVTPVCAEEELAKMAEALKNGLNNDLQRGPIPEPGALAIPDDGNDADRKRKFCIPIGFRSTGDLSNLGAHAVNVVKSTFTVTRPGQKALGADAVKPIDTRVPWAPPDPTKVRAPPRPKKKKLRKP